MIINFSTADANSNVRGNVREYSRESNIKRK